MKAWRHFALFGRIDGLYSRQMLLKSLAEQKTLVSDLEKTMSEQTLELEDCKTVVTHEITKRQDLESKFTNALNDVNTLKMKNHHYEQEIRRLESVIQVS